MLAPYLALGEGPSTPAPPQALPKFEVRNVYQRETTNGTSSTLLPLSS
ncbi:protein of unknown function [Methylotuvimicrobium alcaliphilum 20Z]|uniref:Uncharacterized protein n=1 Tax=Methylotuvimicrobium alcaliphilum (strain DSM 19304 / NCIMB 14124 / VKM B-2133 / 20Z) TaxID=1091494 RepID=G4T3H3_META2|nr:protein of unknown function [Methylotuvimicrobium alcaliphilum 20Z]